MTDIIIALFVYDVLKIAFRLLIAVCCATYSHLITGATIQNEANLQTKLERENFIPPPNYTNPSWLNCS